LNQDHFLTNTLLYAHIGAGILGILVGLGAIFAPKMGPMHRRCGAFVWVVVIVATGGCALLADPAFGSISLLFLVTRLDWVKF
jgi:hypothetical protein